MKNTIKDFGYQCEGCEKTLATKDALKVHKLKKTALNVQPNDKYAHTH